MLSTTQFSRNTKTKTMTADMSDLGNDPFVRAYDDACDLGLPVVSHVTGKVIMWVNTAMEMDREGDLQTMTFEPTAQSLRTNRNATGWQIVLFND